MANNVWGFDFWIKATVAELQADHVEKAGSLLIVVVLNPFYRNHQRYVFLEFQAEASRESFIEEGVSFRRVFHLGECTI